jgi:hypothetical protein
LNVSDVVSCLEQGATALGPALAVAVGIASQQVRSEIILCSDGIPNIGLGSLDGLTNEKVSNLFVCYSLRGLVGLVDSLFSFSVLLLLLLFCYFESHSSDERTESILRRAG